MGRSIAIASGKGGVGKTTITGNLGIALAMRGVKTVLVDADIAMANLSLLLGMQNSPITLHEILMGEAAIEDGIYQGPKGVELIPSGLSLDSYRKADPSRIRGVIKKLETMYDYVLIDAPAGIETTVMAVLSSAQQTLIVTAPNTPSVLDAVKTKSVTQALQGKPIGVIVNMFRGEQGEVKKDDIAKLLELPLYGTIPYDEEMRKTFLTKKIEPVILRAPNAPSSRAIHEIAENLSGIKMDTNVKKESIFSKILSFFKKK